MCESAIYDQHQMRLSRHSAIVRYAFGMHPEPVIPPIAATDASALTPQQVCELQCEKDWADTRVMLGAREEDGP